MRRRLDRVTPLLAASAALSLALAPTRAQDTELLGAIGIGPVAEAVAVAGHAHEADSATSGTVAPGARPETPAAPAATPAGPDLLALLSPELLALEPVALEDRLAPAWWSDVTDSWPLEPARQRRRAPRRCRTRGGYREHCSGERLVREPTGLAAAIADRFSLGERGTAMAMMHQAAYDEWIALAAGGDADARLDWPVRGGHRGRGFGYTRTGELSHRRHQGIDIGAPEGTPIRAARGGLVVYGDNHITGYGNMVIVLHADGDSTFYAHCRRITVAAGEHVERGDVIGEVGETGFAGAPHLHFEWRHDGRARDPMRRIVRETMHVEDGAATAEDSELTDAEPDLEGAADRALATSPSTELGGGL